MSPQGSRRKKKRRQGSSVMGLVVIVLALVVGLTAGGIVLALRQTREPEGGKTLSESSQSADASKETSKEEPKTTAASEDTVNSQAQTQGTVEPDVTQALETEAEADEIETEAETEEVVKTPTTFAEICEFLTEQVSVNQSYLSVDDPNFESARQLLLTVDPSELTGDDLDLYQILIDHVELEEEGFRYRNNETLVDARLTDVPNGQEYYAYLLRKYTGTDYTASEMQPMLAAELNNEYAVGQALIAENPSISVQANDLYKDQAMTSYLFTSMTANSNLLKLICVPEGFRNGWQEFSMIRTYQSDGELTESMREYLIATTRVSYALYGLLDISVHYGGWTEADVQKSVNDYYGAGSEALASQIYADILKNPGRYVGAAIGFQCIANAEAVMATNIPGYTEQNLLDVLFSRGPAPFRIIYQWIGLTTGSEE